MSKVLTYELYIYVIVFQLPFICTFLDRWEYVEAMQILQFSSNFPSSINLKQNLQKWLVQLRACSHFPSIP